MAKITLKSPILVQTKTPEGVIFGSKQLNRCESYDGLGSTPKVVRADGVYYDLIVGYSPIIWGRVPESNVFLDDNGNPMQGEIMECVVPSMMGTTNETKTDVATTTTPSKLNWKTLAIVGGVIAVGYYLIKKKIIKIK